MDTYNQQLTAAEKCVARHLRPGEAVDKPARRRALPGFGTAYDRAEMYHVNICHSLNKITETTCVTEWSRD